MIFRNMLLSVRNESRETISIQDRRLLELLGIEPDEINVKGKNALKEITVYSCVRIRSEFMSVLPLKVYQDQNGKKKVTDHYLNSLLKLRPNPHMTSSAFKKAMEAQRTMFGNGYANIEWVTRGPNKGRVKALWPMDASKVTVVVDDTISVPSVLGSGNRVAYVVDVGGEQRKLKPEDVLHIKGVTLDGLVGIPPIEILRASIENAAAGTEYINKFFRHGLQSRGIVQYVGDLDAKAKETFRKNFEEMSSGLNNAHRISLLPIGYQFQPIQLSLTDAQFLENAELTIRQIAAAFGVKMHQLNDLDRATHTNIAEQQREFYAATGQAMVTDDEEEFTYKLFLDSELADGYYLKFNVDAIIRSDIKTRYEAYKTGIQAGFLKPNEAREKEEMEPDPYGDKLLANGNMIPLEMVGQQYLKKGGGGDEVLEDPSEREEDR
jgi:HK97 family phage portal protein